MNFLRTTLITFLFSLSSIFAGDFIPHTVGVMVSPKGYQGISRNIENLLFLNGISPNSFYLDKIEMLTPEGPLESLIQGENQAELYNLVKTWREYLQRILIGVNLDKHQFALEASDLEANLEWENVDLDFTSATEAFGKDASGVILTINARAADLTFSVNKVRGHDLLNPYLGEAGFNGVKVLMDNSTGPLEIEAQIHLQKDKGNFKAEILPLKWNWQDIALQASYDRPLIFPKVQILINDHPIDVDLEELDNIFKEKLPQLLEKANVAVERYIKNEGIDTINGAMASAIAGGGITETNQMAPPGAPVGRSVKPFVWGLHLDLFTMRGENLFLNMSGFARDGNKIEDLRLSSIKSATRPFKQDNALLAKHDAAIAINQGLINQVIKLSAKRGYFDAIEAGGEAVKLSSTPIFDLTKKSPRISVEVEYTVKGLASAFVRNPIRIQMDLLVDFPVQNGKSKIVTNGVDLDTVRLDDKYIRMFKKKVQSTVKSEVKKLQSNLKGYVLADELPLPSSLLGIGLEIKNIKIDKNGHLVIYQDFDWSALGE